MTIYTQTALPSGAVSLAGYTRNGLAIGVSGIQEFICYQVEMSSAGSKILPKDSALEIVALASDAAIDLRISRSSISFSVAIAIAQGYTALSNTFCQKDDSLELVATAACKATVWARPIGVLENVVIY